VASLMAVSRDVAYAISDTGALSRTGDGGRHWTQVLPAPAPAGHSAEGRDDPDARLKEHPTPRVVLGQCRA
jgi:photosystem II stability/assembly factor-like uncharacterized protein